MPEEGELVSVKLLLLLLMFYWEIIRDLKEDCNDKTNGRTKKHATCYE